MPNYDFICDGCGFKEEIFRSIKDENKVACPECSKNIGQLIPMRQLISGTNFILKGDGWAGQDIKRANEDDGLRDISRRGRELKESGRVAGDKILTTQDVERMNP
jgi:putative FmdB family regulatory protein